jgi:hypothetical protein
MAGRKPGTCTSEVFDRSLAPGDRRLLDDLEPVFFDDWIG